MNSKRILLIGGTGALGKTLTWLYHMHNTIKIFSRDEHKQVALSKMWPNVQFMIGDVKDKDALINAIEDFEPQIIINTAALKHVPVCEINPFESVNVNILGHQNLLDAINRSRHGIETVIFISSDKACKPINIYGMCKSISERLYIEFAKKQTMTKKICGVKVCIVRYGNVLESTGSVIPYFKQLLAEGKTELPVTDPRMTRFLLTLDRAAKLIDWSYEHPQSHGHICVPKVKSFKITAIADALMRAYNVAGTTKITGIRKGEKLHEEMISAEEWMRSIDCGENFMITDECLKSDAKSFNSFDALMPDDQVFDFLKQCKVI